MKCALTHAVPLLVEEALEGLSQALALERRSLKTFGRSEPKKCSEDTVADVKACRRGRGMRKGSGISLYLVKRF